jgi:hypothetical protein
MEIAGSTKLPIHWLFLLRVHIHFLLHTTQQLSYLPFFCPSFFVTILRQGPTLLMCEDRTTDGIENWNESESLSKKKASEGNQSSMWINYRQNAWGQLWHQLKLQRIVQSHAGDAVRCPQFMTKEKTGNKRHHQCQETSNCDDARQVSLQYSLNYDMTLLEFASLRANHVHHCWICNSLTDLQSHSRFFHLSHWAVLLLEFCFPHGKTWFSIHSL